MVRQGSKMPMTLLLAALMASLASGFLAIDPHSRVLSFSRLFLEQDDHAENWSNNNSSNSLHNNNNPRRRGFLWRRITGDGTPYGFPVTPVAFNRTWTTETYFNKYAFSRLDYYNDGIFYTLPRPVYHLDEPAICSITQYYRRHIAPGSRLLDLGASWVSHYPMEFPDTMERIVGTGMNALELSWNDQLDEYTVVDLNQPPPSKNATLLGGYPSGSFDVITSVATIDYLIDPIQVLRECHRLLRPGGQLLISFSNRCFGLKAVKVWTSMRFPGQADLVNGYLHYAGGFGSVRAYDITAQLPTDRYQDPLVMVRAIKEG